MRVQTSDGFVVDVEGQDSEDALLLIHAAVTFDGCRPLLAERSLTDRRRVIHYYRRGYGGSPAAPQGFRIADQVADARAVLASMGVERAHVLGHSIGGIIGLQLALDTPETVRSLVLVEPTFVTRPELLDWYQAALAPVVAAYSTGDRLSAADHLLRLLDGEAYRHSLDAALGAGWFEAAAAALDLYFGVELPAAVSWSLPADRAATITRPALLLRGTPIHDQFSTLFDDIESLLPTAVGARVPDASHNVIACRPAEAAELINQFVSRFN